MSFKSLFVLTLPILTRAQLSFYPNNTLIVSGGVSTACLNALNATVQCDPYLVSLATADDYTTLNNDTVQKSVCDPLCGSKLSKYQSSVKSACKNDPIPWSDIPAVYFGDFVWAYYNGSCLRDPATGAWCKDYISNISSTLTSRNRQLAQRTIMFAMHHRALQTPAIHRILELRQQYGRPVGIRTKDLQHQCANCSSNAVCHGNRKTWPCSSER